MSVPFLDLRRQYESIQDELRPAIGRVMEKGWFILGEEVESFEREFAEYCGVKHCVAVGSGTEAIHLALVALGIGEGDEVITVANSFIATALGISYAGAVPVFTEIRPDTCNMDFSRIEEKITKRTRAIVPVHLYGRPADMEEILAIGEKHGLRIIEDACQAHGARYKGRMVGSLGNAGCFSFYPGKNLGACGDGGALTTNDDLTAEKLRLLHNYGQKKKYEHLLKGFNSRLDEMQAAILRVKLKYLEKWNARRAKIAESYAELLRGADISIPSQDMNSIWHIYPARAKRRDGLRDYLKKKGIDTLIHYPVPIHLQEAYRELGYRKGDLPVTEQYADELLSLPIFPEMTDTEVEMVACRIREFLPLS